MRRSVLAIAAAAVMLPGIATAQTVGVFKGTATLSPALHGTPCTACGGYNFSGTVSGGVGGGAVSEVGGKFLPGASCSGNAHMGTAEITPSGNGLPYQGVCVGPLCIGGGVSAGGGGSYQLLFTVATSQNAIANCPDPPAGTGKGLGSAAFDPGGWEGS